MTLFEQRYPNYDCNYFVIENDDIKDNAELFKEYMLFLQQFCTYTFNVFKNNSPKSTNSFLTNLRTAWTELAQEYIYSKTATKNEIIENLNKIRILRGKPLYQFAVCDIVMMTENPKVSFDELKKCLPNYAREMNLQDSTADIKQFYDKCQKILEKSCNIINDQEIQIIENNWKDYLEIICDDISEFINKKTKIAHNEYCNFCIKVNAWLLSLSKMLSNRLKVGNHIIVQKLYEFKQIFDLNIFYQAFGEFIMIDKGTIHVPD